MEKPESGFSFRIMAFGFKLRDLFRPRGDVLREVCIQPGARVLDFGCGPGGYILPLYRLVGPYGTIYALDINPTAIRAVKKIALKHNLNNVETILSDGKTGLTDMSMDFVLLYDVLHHLSHPENILADLHRVLKPDGVLSMSDHHLKEEEITTAMTASGYFRLLRRGEKVYNFSRV
jgi:2-polyprenyl-3-methyl-5-hydroxy-6-metoxy-1,4-benzoquinol methylase